FLFFALFLCLYCFRGMIGQDIKYLTLFYGLCIFFFMLLARAMSIARFGKTILIVFIITDLLIYNCSNRPLMLMKRIIPFSTAAQKPVFSARRVSNVAYWTPMPRYKSILFRKHAIEKNFNTVQSSYVELKNFNKLMDIPDNNLRAITGVSQPIIGFYQKALPYRDEYFNMYFMNPAAEGVLREVLFINDVAAVDRDLLWDARVDGVPNDDLPRYKMLKYSPSDIEIETQTQRKSFLYFSDGYDNYWKAYVDSKPVTLYRANINFKAVIVPPGEHTVRFVYRPVFHIVALWLYFLTLSAVSFYVLLYLIMRVAARRKKGTA
ncbi:MAG: YfhO family protein, partial [Candidatus Omnitrophota bacterium]